jgi:hypothetical protein
MSNGFAIAVRQLSQNTANTANVKHLLEEIKRLIDVKSRKNR